MLFPLSRFHFEILKIIQNFNVKEKEFLKQCNCGFTVHQLLCLLLRITAHLKRLNFVLNKRRELI